MELKTRKKILHSALEVFGEKGFRGGTIREICHKAGVNIALVGYHFKNKKNLYEETVDRVISEIWSRHPLNMYITDDMDEKSKLRGIINMLLNRATAPDGIRCDKEKLKIFMREITEPTDVLEKLLYAKVLEIRGILVSTISSLLKNRKESDINYDVLSVVGQCMYPMFASEILKIGGFNFTEQEEVRKAFAEHIYNFTLGAIDKANGDII